MSVRNTPTAADALLERKKINDEIAILTQKRDTARRECEQWASAKEAIRLELAAKTGLVFSTEQYDKLLSLDLKKQREEIRTSIEELERSHATKKLSHTDIMAAVNVATELKEKIEKNIETLKVDEGFHKKAAEVARLDHLEAKESKEKVLGEIDKKIADANKLLQAINTEREEKQPWILQEETRLARKASDLAIYEARIRKMAVAVGLDPVNIVIHE